MNFDMAILVPCDKRVLGWVEASCGDLMALRELELIDLRQVHSHVQFGHGPCAPVERVKQLLPLVANDQVATTVSLQLIFHDQRLLSETVREESVVDSHGFLLLRDCAKDVIIVYQVKVRHSGVHIFVKGKNWHF